MKAKYSNIYKKLWKFYKFLERDSLHGGESVTLISQDTTLKIRNEITPSRMSWIIKRFIHYELDKD